MRKGFRLTQWLRPYPYKGIIHSSKVTMKSLAAVLALVSVQASACYVDGYDDVHASDALVASYTAAPHLVVTFELAQQFAQPLSAPAASTMTVLFDGNPAGWQGGKAIRDKFQVGEKFAMSSSSLYSETASGFGNAFMWRFSVPWNYDTATVTHLSTNLAEFTGEAIMSPAPEPDTYALMALGIGAMGWLQRRKLLASDMPC